MNLKKVAAAGLALSLVAGATQAQTVMAFQDDDIDFVLTSGLTVRTTGTLAVNNILVAVFEIPSFTIGGVNAIPAGQELTGVSAVRITGITGTSLQFGPVPGGLNAILALGTDPDATVGPVGNAGAGATTAMFLNETSGAGGDIDLILDSAQLGGRSNCTSLANCINQASRGTLYQVDGFAGDPDEFWTAFTFTGAGLSIATVRGTNNALQLGIFNAAQTTMFSAAGTIVGQNVSNGAFCPTAGPGCVAGPVLSGTIVGGAGLVNGAFAHSDLRANKLLLRQVPEPEVLALLAVGFIAAGVASRRRSL